MRLTYIASSTIPSRTANSIHVMNMCSAYAEHGLDVTLLIPDNRDKEEANVKDVYSYYGVNEGFKIVKVKPRRPVKLWYAMELSRQALKTKADVFHSRIEITAWSLARVFGKSTILELHDNQIQRSWWRNLARSISRSSNLIKIITITQALKQQLYGVIEESKFLVLPDGVDRTSANSRISTSDARRKIGLCSETKPIALYAGQLYEGRGIELIIEIAKRHREYQFLIVGGNNDSIALYKSATSGLENINFTGFVPPSEVANFLAASDCLLMPYSANVRHAGNSDTGTVMSPLKMFEYMAAAKPIIASDIDVLKEVLQPNHNCLMARIGDVDDWSLALARLYNDSELCERLGSAAKQDVQQYTWSERASRILNACSDHKSLTKAKLIR